MRSIVVVKGAPGEAGELVFLTGNEWTLKTGPHTPGF